DPRADEPRARVDTRVRTYDIETSVFPGSLIDRGVERFVIRNVNRLSAYIQPRFAEPPRLVFDTLRVNVEHGDARAFGRQGLGWGQPDSALPACHDSSVTGDVEQLRDFLHRRTPQKSAARR